MRNWQRTRTMKRRSFLGSVLGMLAYVYCPLVRADDQAFDKSQLYETWIDGHIRLPGKELGNIVMRKHVWRHEPVGGLTLEEFAQQVWDTMAEEGLEADCVDIVWWRNISTRQPGTKLVPSDVFNSDSTLWMEDEPAWYRLRRGGGG